MPKKKIPELIVAPVTFEEYMAMVETWLKLKPILDTLGIAVTTKEKDGYGWPSYESHWPDGYHDIKPEGIVFYHLEPNQYDDGYHNDEELIPLDALMNPQIYIAAAEEIKTTTNKKVAALQKERERNQYEELRKKFEK